MKETIDLINEAAILDNITDGAIDFGKNIFMAAVIYFVGRFVIKMINKILLSTLERRQFDPAVKSFLSSSVNIVLQLMLILSVIAALGVQMTSFAALLASAGVAIGMALSGNLQNFAGGLVILVLKPYRIGDYIQLNSESGTVAAIQIFNTILTTPDNKTIVIPNATISNGVLINYSHQTSRRVDFSFGVEYGTDFDYAKQVLKEILEADSRIFLDPAPLIVLGALADSSVNITVRVWTLPENYWAVFFETNEKVYKTFNEKGIAFPFPQLTVHMKSKQSNPF